MKNKHLLPLAVFCILFLAYSLYFVKVINTTERLEPNSIAKTIKRAIDDRGSEQSTTMLDKPSTKYVNYDWLNVRKQPSLSSGVIEKIFHDDVVELIGHSGSSWSYIKTQDGQKGYVASRYLTDQASNSITELTKDNDTPAVVANGLFQIPTITYHHITDEVGRYPENLTLATPNFFAQLDYLVEHGFQTITFYELQDIVTGKKEAPRSVILTFDDGYDDAYVAAQHLNGKGLKGVFFIIPEKVGTEGYLDWRQVKKMREWGMEIGSHGLTSADLTRATDFYLDQEVSRSKLLIEQMLGEEIVSFAYPAGNFNDRAMDAVKESGYQFARSISSGSQYTANEFFKLPTLRVFPRAGKKQFSAWLGE